MLEVDATVTIVGSTAGKVTCDVQLPADWHAAKPTGEPLPTIVDDRRRFPRFHYRVRGLFEPWPTFPDHVRPKQVFVVYTKDISRGGIAFLHAEELFPKEHGQLRLPPRFEQAFEVVRCMRLGDHGYLVGGRFPEPLPFEVLSALVG
jgi:hypothetical protein